MDWDLKIWYVNLMLNLLGSELCFAPAGKILWDVHWGHLGIVVNLLVVDERGFWGLEKRGRVPGH